jgi:hypothetical protein
MDDDIFGLVGTLLGGFVLFLFMRLLVSEPGRVLRRKFLKLGRLKGQNKSVIFVLAGPPNAVSALPNGKTLCQWQAAGYHIALIFDADNICEGVSHEAIAR